MSQFPRRHRWLHLRRLLAAARLVATRDWRTVGAGARRKHSAQCARLAKRCRCFWEETAGMTQVGATRAHVPVKPPPSEPYHERPYRKVRTLSKKKTKASWSDNLDPSHAIAKLSFNCGNPYILRCVQIYACTSFDWERTSHCPR